MTDLYQCQVQIITISPDRPHWSTSTGLPTFYVRACCPESAVAKAKLVATSSHTPLYRVGTCGTVALALGEHLECDGTGYLSWNNAPEVS